MANGNAQPQQSADPVGLPPETLRYFGIQPQPTGVLGKVGQFLGNPAVQGLATAYLTAASQPRYEGLGGALARGGLSGLGAFTQAQRTQAMMPLERAKAMGAVAQIGKTLADTKLSGARTALAQAETGQYEPSPALADHFDVLAANEPDPTRQTMYALLSHGMRNGMKSSDAIRALSTGDLNEVRKALAQANIQVAGARLGEIGAQTQHLQSATETEQMRQRGALPPAAKGPQFETMMDLSTGRAVSVDKTKGLPPNVVPSAVYNQIAGGRQMQQRATAWQKAYSTALTDFRKSHPRGPMGIWGPSDDAADSYAQNKANEFIAGHFGVGTPTAALGGSAPAAAPITATGPDGSKVQWNGTAWVPMGR
jgi:hypothetical protein